MPNIYDEATAYQAITEQARAVRNKAKEEPWDTDLPLLLEDLEAQIPVAYNRLWEAWMAHGMAVA